VKIAARAVLPTGYWHLGRYWPRDKQVEVEVTEQEYAQLSLDHNIVVIPVPEADRKAKGR